MKNELALKVYDIDYSFIVRNYLSEDLWDKNWTLFVYKNVKVSLELYEIEVQKPVKIVFKIIIDDGEYRNYEYCYYDRENTSIKILKQQINGKIRDLIDTLERYHIRNESGYIELKDRYNDEREELTEIAKSYLDENNITLSDVRDAYISKYVDDNVKGYTYMDNYINGRKYLNKSDLWLIFYKVIGNDKKYDEICDIINKANVPKSIFTEIQEYIDTLSNDESEEYVEYFNDMSCRLEAI